MPNGVICMFMGSLLESFTSNEGNETYSQALLNDAAQPVFRGKDLILGIKKSTFGTLKMIHTRVNSRVRH